MADVIIHFAAEADYDAALSWYLARSARAGIGFAAHSTRRSNWLLRTRAPTRSVMTGIDGAGNAGTHTGWCTAWKAIR